MNETIWHVIWGLAIVLIAGYLIYSATHAQTENNRYVPGSSSYDVKITNFPLSFGCVPISALQEAFKKRLEGVPR